MARRARKPVNDETSITRPIAQIEMDKRRDRSEEMERNRKVRPRKRKKGIGGETRECKGGAARRSASDNLRVKG